MLIIFLLFFIYFIIENYFSLYIFYFSYSIIHCSDDNEKLPLIGRVVLKTRPNFFYKLSKSHSWPVNFSIRIGIITTTKKSLYIV
jgi:hypothetical protein